MTPGEEFRLYMKAANRDQRNPSDPHLSEATIIAYYRDELPESERETSQAHLVICPTCIALLQSVSDFFEPPGADEEDVTQAETNQQWQSFLQRVKAPAPEGSEKTETPVAVVQADFNRARDKKLLLDSRVTLAMAASLLISLGAVGWLAWSYRQERQSSQEVAAELQHKQQELQHRLAQLTETEAEIKREREQRLAAEAERDQLQELLAAARPPGDDVRVYPFLLSSDRGSAEELQLKLNTAANVHLLISKPDTFAQYEVDILDEGGRSVRKFRGLRPQGVDRSLRFRLNRGALSPGKYQLRLLGQQGGASTLLGEHSLLVAG